MNKSELEQRAKARRDAALQSDKESDLEDRAKARRAYLQGGPGPNNPKNLGFPGEMKYPRMEVPVGGDSRQWEQSWFENAAAVTKEKMGPSGVELELKKKMQRAKLSAKFVKQANQNDSYWEFYATDKDSGKKGLVFRASVDEIWGREGHGVSADDWKWVSSKDYAQYAMEKMRSEGVNKVAYALKGVALTKTATNNIIREEALDKAKAAMLVGRRIARNLKLADDQFKAALTQDYKDLQAVLADLKLVDKSVQQVANVKASDDKNRFVVYKLADEALQDATATIQDVLHNVQTAELTLSNKINKKAEEVVVEEQPAPAAPAVENPDRAKQKSAPMPGGGMPYEEGGQLYPEGDSRHTAPMNDQLAAAHGDLPFREWEQLELKNLSEGPHGHQRSFDKAEWATEETEEHESVPTGNVYDSKEATGGGVSHTDELQEQAPGLNTDLPDGRWGFDHAGGDYLTLPEGGLQAVVPEGHEEPMAEDKAAPAAPAQEEEAEEAPEEDAGEEAEEEDQGEEEEAAEEDEEKDEAEKEDEEEEKEASQKNLGLDRRSRAAKRQDMLKSFATDPNQEAYDEKLGHMSADPQFQKYYDDLAHGSGSPGKGSAGKVAEVAPELWDKAGATKEEAWQAAGVGGDAPMVEGADEEVKASFNAKNTKAAKDQVALKQKRAYDLALDFQSKGWIENSKEALHTQASQFANMDEPSFKLFKNMIQNLKTVKNASLEEKIEKIAGKQRKVIKSGASPQEEENLVKALGNLDWS